MKNHEVKITNANVAVYHIPDLTPESDGTLSWEFTNLVLVEIESGNERGIGYTYADVSTAALIKNTLLTVIDGMNVFDIPAIWWKMVRAIRNLGRSGISSMAISAVDNALWDLKAKLLNLPLVSLMGCLKDKVEVYGSGGFTNYTNQQLEKQIELWKSYGIKKIKIKVGRDPLKDLKRIEELISKHSFQLFIDANGAFTRKEALHFGNIIAEMGVVWFEEPVTSDDLYSLNFLSSSMPAPVAITAGEYGYDRYYFRKMLEANAVDILQVDATRCGGFTEMQKVIHLSSSFNVPVSTHCAPYLHLHPACASEIIHMEYFFDHFRIEKELFDGGTDPIDGFLTPDFTKPGIGLDFKKNDAKKYLIA